MVNDRVLANPTVICERDVESATEPMVHSPTIKTMLRPLTRLGSAVAAVSLAVVLWGGSPLSVVSWPRLLTLIAAVVAAFAPREALLVLTAAIPLAFLGPPISPVPFRFLEAFVVACVAGWIFRAAVHKNGLNAVPRELLLPATLIALVVACSAVVQLSAIRAADPPTFDAALRRALTRDYFADPGPLQDAAGAMLHLESLALFCAAAAVTRRHTGVVPQFVRMLTAGAIAAALLNLQRFATVALRSEAPLATLRAAGGPLRINTAYSDVNAAGSYFALAAVAATGLIAAAPDAWKTLPIAALGAILAAMWLTGSRAAVAATIVTVAAASFWRLVRERRNRRAAWLVLAGCAAGSAVFLTMFPNRMTGPGTGVAVLVRREMWRISFEMVRQHPWFGVGVGQFYNASAPLIAASPLAQFYWRENAHNNVLQIVAEAGLAGAAAYAWLLVAVIRRMRVTLAAISVQRPVFEGLIGGLTAFSATALVGHPLLTPEVSFTFALALGVAAGSAETDPEVVPTRTRVRARSVAIVAAVMLMLCLPFRIRQHIANANLEHVGWGLSSWETDAMGERFRRMLGPATFFVPSDALWIDFQYRLIDPAHPVTLSLTFRRREADRLVVRDDRWQRYILRVPPMRVRTRFEPLLVQAVAGDASNVLVAKIVSH